MNALRQSTETGRWLNFVRKFRVLRPDNAGQLAISIQIRGARRQVDLRHSLVSGERRRKAITRQGIGHSSFSVGFVISSRVRNVASSHRPNHCPNDAKVFATIAIKMLECLSRDSPIVHLVSDSAMSYRADMSPTPTHRRSVLLSFKFLGTALVGSLTMALVCAFGSLPAQLAVLGAFISILAGLFLSYLEQEEERERRRNEVLEELAVPLTLAPEHDLYDQYLAICTTLTELAGNSDPILREIAVLKLASVTGQLDALAGGTAVFAGTEAWRTVYEKLLASPDINEYQSVAWVRSKEYWQDQPGRQSMRANFDACHRGTLIERIVILDDNLWPQGQLLPGDDLLRWLEEQNNNGLRVSLVRQSDLAGEPDLLADFGIYGERACGFQELDERGRTIRFVLHFDPGAVRLARDRWERLMLYATSLRNLLDRAPANH